MEELLRQITWASNAGAYFIALLGALSVPDICGALDSPGGEATGQTYKDWFDAHVAPSCYGMMDGDDCYKFRCSLLHQGTTQHPKGGYARIIFVEPGASGNVFHMNVMNDALNIDVRLFCQDIVTAATAWQASVVGTEPYETNVRKFVTRYPNGLPPYIVGIPVIS
jgi:hypothetical protein